MGVGGSDWHRMTEPGLSHDPPTPRYFINLISRKKGWKQCLKSLCHIPLTPWAPFPQPAVWGIAHPHHQPAGGPALSRMRPRQGRRAKKDKAAGQGHTERGESGAAISGRSPFPNPSLGSSPPPEFLPPATQPQAYPVLWLPSQPLAYLTKYLFLNGG